MTLMKEAAHPCTMQPRQTQMASKYHVEGEEDCYFYELASSYGDCFTANVCGLFIFLLPFPESTVGKLRHFIITIKS